MPLCISRTSLALVTLNSPVPFLYQTQTLTAPLRYAKWNARQARSLQSASTAFTPPEPSLGRGEESVHDSESSENTTPPLKSGSPSQRPSNNGRRSRTSYLKKKRAATVSQSHPLALQPGQKTLTMTSAEKKAFGSLLEQMVVKEKEKKDDPEADTEVPEKVALSEDEMSQINNIFNAVLRDIRKKEQGSEDPTEGSAERKRKGRTKADFSERARAIQSIVKREKAKIESALRAAIDEGKGDTGILEVCEERIFSLLRYLGDGRLSGDSGTPMTSTETSTETNTEDSGTPTTSSADEPTPHSTLEVPESVPVEEVVLLLYPKMLLVAFRLLNSHFPGSPLISQFHSMVKSHGRTSAVLGSSTRLYNELLYFYWRGCSDLPSVVSLLKEMETTGLEPDEGTCALLKSISEQRVRDLQREARNNWDWWDMAPNQTAVRELFGENGWLPRLEKRVKELRTLPSSSSTKLLADRFEM